MIPKVYNKHHGDAPKDAIYIGRGSPYGNPYTVAEYEGGYAIEMFRKHVLPTLDVSALRGKHLICFCKPRACHGDLILEKANMPIIEVTEWSWARKDPNGYEVSSKGDKRFSAFYALMSDGKSVEYWYQVKVKGYKSIEEGKGKAPKRPFTRETTWELYLSLWGFWALDNLNLLKELRNQTKEHKVLTDMFASTDINQARALAHILNEWGR